MMEDNKIRARAWIENNVIKCLSQICDSECFRFNTCSLIENINIEFIRDTEPIVCCGCEFQTEKWTSRYQENPSKWCSKLEKICAENGRLKECPI